MTNKLINKLGIGALTLVLAGSFWGCRDSSNDFCKSGKYNGYDVWAVFDGNERRVMIYSNIDEDLSGNSGISKDVSGKAGICGTEHIQDLKDKKRFSEIQKNKEVTKGHPLEAYMNLDSLEKIYNYVYKNGNNCNEVKK